MNWGDFHFTVHCLSFFRYADKNYKVVHPNNHEIIKNVSELQDGLKVVVKRISNDSRQECCFSNYLWKRETISELICECGFKEVKWLPVSGLPNSPSKMLTAVKL